MEELIEFFSRGGVLSIVLAILIVILTALIKIPIKKMAERQALPAKVTRYIPFIPVVLGGIFSAFITWFKTGALGEQYYELWLCSTGASIALYSIFVNFRDSGKLEFSDLLKQGICTLLRQKLGNTKNSELKELTEKIDEWLIVSKSGGTGDFYAEMQELLKNYMDNEEIGDLIKQVEKVWTELYGESHYNEEVEKIACTATEKYEYEVRKSRTATQAYANGKTEENNDET